MESCPQVDHICGEFLINYITLIIRVLFLATEWHFIIYIPDGIYSISGSKYQINFMKSAIKENPELLQNNMKRVIGIIIGLLKNRVNVDSSLTSKKVKIKKFIKK